MEIHPKPLPTMASDANLLWAHPVQGTAVMANLTPHIPLPSGMQVTLIVWPQDHCKVELTAPPMQTTSQLISIEHHRLVSNHDAAAFNRQYTMVPHHQVIASTPILLEIALELTKKHPIKGEPSPTPPKILLDQTLPFWMQSGSHHHPPTTPIDPSPPGFCLYSNSCGNHLTTREDTLNQKRDFSHTSHNSSRLENAVSEAIVALPPSTNNAERLLITRP
jgi:hypothetical protein